MKTIFGLWLLAFAIWQTGCATPRSPQTGDGDSNLPCATPPPLAALGTIGVTATSTVPKFSMTEPLSRSEAGELTARRIVFLGQDDFTDDASMVAAQLTLGLSIWALCAVAVPSRAVAEGFALPERKLAKASSSMEATLCKLNLQDELRAQVVQQTAARASVPIKLVQKPFPPGREVEFSRMSCVMAGTLAWLPRGQSAADYLAEQGIDTVLELQLIHPGLKGSGRINPSLTLCVDVRAMLLEAESGRELWKCTAQYRSQKHKFIEWAEDEARLFRHELDRCFVSLAGQITDRFVGGAIENARPAAVEIARH